LAAVFFGSTFPVTKEALGGAGPYAVTAIRFLAGGLVLLPWARRRPRADGEVRATFWCSLALLSGYLLLTVGLQSTTSTAAAFITYLLVVIVPVVSAMMTRRLPSRAVTAGVALATFGLLLLVGRFRLGLGEWLTLGCAFAFAGHILFLGAFAARVDVVRLTAFQLVAVGLGSTIPALALGEMRGLSGGALLACGYLAAVGVGGLLLQIAGQRVVGPTRASLLLMLEPILAALGGYAIGERITTLGFVGAGLILAGILVSELDPPFWQRDPAVDGGIPLPKPCGGPETLDPAVKRDR